MTERPNRLQRGSTRAALQKRPYAAKPPLPAPLPQDYFPGDAENADQSGDVVTGTWRIARSSAHTWGILLSIISIVVWAAGFSIGFPTALSILLGIGFLLSIVGLFIPTLGILAIGMVCALDAIAAEFLYTGGLLRFNTLNYWLLLVIALSIPFVLRLSDLNSRLLQIFTLLLALELVFSSDIPEGVQDVLNLVTVFGIVVYFARSLKDTQALYWLGIVNGVLAGMGGLVFMIQAPQLPYANPNNWTYFQLTALFSICISFYYAHLHRKNRLILLILAAVNFTWIFLSGSRGSLIVALLCVLYLFLSTRSISLSSIALGMAILVGLFISTQFAEQQFYTISRIQLLFDESRSEAQRTSKRSVLAEAGIELFLENPLGVGTGSFDKEVGQTSVLVRGRPAHSGWIKTLAENGIPGIILLTAFVASYAVEGFRKRQQGLLLFGIFITLVFAVSFIAKEFQGKSLWFLAAAGIVLLHANQILPKMQQRNRPYEENYRQRLREVRFGRKK